MAGIRTTPIETTSVPDENDPAKTVMTLTGGETVKADVNLEVKAETVSDPENSEKTITTLSEPTKFKLTVIGPFAGTVEFDNPSTLKELVSQIDSPEGTFGSFKYRDEAGEPVGLNTEIDKDMNLSSIHRGS